MQSTGLSQHLFAQVPRAEIPRAAFDRSHGVKTTFDSGYLVPVFVDEVLPGDTFNLQATFFARLSTPKYPIMDNLFLDSFFFFVPLRLLWTNFQKFMGAQTNPGDSTSYNTPQVTAHTPAVGSLQDYMGLPTQASVAYNAFHTRAYNLIYNEWFRDQNLQNSVTVDTGDGPDNSANYVLLRRGKRHDYFTSCLPWPQKSTAVTIPLGTTAGFVNPTSPSITGTATAPTWNNAGSGGPNALDQTAGSTAIQWGGASGGAGTNNATWVNPQLTWNVNSMLVDLTNATAATINQLRQSFQLQKMYERDARGGTRYTEVVRSHFGVTSPDARLQRPEYLGGGSAPINIHPVAQTATGGTYGVGALAAFGTSSATGHGFTKSFTEHGVILGLVNVRADLTYQSRLDRMWTRRTRTDYYWPALAQIGEQSVLNQEIYYQNNGSDTGVFGYQERYAEYRYKPSQVCGLFRSQAASTIDVWHLAEKFTSLPTLGATFIQSTPPISRVVVVNTDPQFIMDSYFRLKCVRPMPVFGVPGNIDRF